jgi:transcriptional regulator with XRE-family HTH domain
MEYKSLNELVTALSPYLNQSALARICDINEGQMRQYISGVRNPSPQTIRKINKGLHEFADNLKDMKVI